LSIYGNKVRTLKNGIKYFDNGVCKGSNKKSEEQGKNYYPKEGDPVDIYDNTSENWVPGVVMSII